MAYTPSLSNSYVQGSGDVSPGSLGVNRIQPAGGFVSQEEFYTLYERPIPQTTNFFARHMNYLPFSFYLKALGFTKGVSTKTTGHYEDPWQDDVFELDTIVTASSGAGNSMVVSLAAANMYDTSVTVGGNARKASYPIVGDVIELAGRVQARVDAKNVTTDPHRLTITPIDSTIDLDDAVTAGDIAAVFYNIHAEATGIPATRAPRTVKYTNEFGRVKTGWSITGDELTNAVYHEVIPGDASSVGKSIYLKVKMDAIKRHEKHKSNMLIFGQTADNLTDTTNQTGLDMTITIPEGFIDFALTHGGVNEYTVGSLALADFDQAGNTMRDERGTSTNELLHLCGPAQALEIENEFQSVLVQNLAPFVDRIMPGSARSLSVDGYQEGLDNNPGDAYYSAGITAFTKNGFTFHTKRLDEFNDIKGAGYSGYGYRNYGHLIPYSYFTNMNGNEDRGAIGYEYKALDGYSRESVVSVLPGAGVGGNTMFGPAVHEYDTMKAQILFQGTLHMACGNQIVSLVPNA